MINLTISVHDERWKKSLRPCSKTLKTACEAVKAHGELAVVLADDTFVQTLNQKYRGKNKPTNVLSFPNDDEPLGDIILAFDTIALEAEAQGKSFRNHTLHLVIHGILHLLGHDHEIGEDAKEMEALEVKILKKLGINNPYLARS